MLSFGNTKLSKSVGIFNLLEIVTCPGRTPFCTRNCYAKKRRCKRNGPRDTVTRYRKNNIVLSERPDFAAEMVRLIKGSGVKKFRIHEAGDFYSQEYLDKWIEIARALPQVTFLAYTRSFDLFNFSAVPANMIVYHSFDPDSPRAPRPDERVALVIPRDADPAESAPGYSVCPTKLMSKRKAHQYCGSKCVQCWRGTQRIAFHRH